MNNDTPKTPGEPDKKVTPTESAEVKGAEPAKAPGSPAKSSSQADVSVSGRGPKTSQTDGKAGAAKKPGRRKAFLWFILLILIVAAAFAGWHFYGKKLQMMLHPGDAEVAAPVDVVASDLSELRQRLSAESEARQTQFGALEKQYLEQQLTLNSHASRLRELAGTSRTDWLLAEAEYLLRLGNQRLLTERNTQNALALLVSADDILREIDDVQLLPVREAVARNIMTLKSETPVDRDGLFLQLKVLAEQAVTVPLLPPALNSADSPDSELPAALDEGAPWYAPLIKAGHLILAEAEKLVVIRRRSDPVDPLLSPEQEQLLRIQLGVVFEQAQLALLREEQQIYEASLSKARTILVRYFEINEQQTKALVEQLDWLGSQQVVQQRPDISEGLNALRDYIDSWHNRHQVEGSGGAQQ